MTLHSGSANGTKVADFAAPATGTGVGNYRYTPTTAVPLSASTWYWLVAEDDGANRAESPVTRDLAYDGAVAPGWTLANKAQVRTSTATGAFSDLAGATRRYQIRVNGVHVPPVPLVTNLGQTTDGSEVSEPWDLAMQFATGANPDGYTLTGVELNLNSTSGTAPPTLTLHSGSATGTKVADFDGPASLSTNATVETFTPTTTVTLSASTDYWVVIEGGANGMGWLLTESEAEDAVSAGGWTIADAFQARLDDSTGSFATIIGGGKPACSASTAGSPRPPTPLPPACRSSPRRTCSACRRC